MTPAQRYLRDLLRHNSRARRVLRRIWMPETHD